MGRDSVLQTFLLVALVAGVTYPVARRTPAATPQAAGAGVQAAGPARRAPLLPVSGGTLLGGLEPGLETAGVKDALTLLAEFFNLDLGSDTLRHAVVHAAEALERPAASDNDPSGGADRDRALEFLGRITGAGGLLPDDVRSAATELVTCARRFDTEGEACSPARLRAWRTTIAAYVARDPEATSTPTHAEARSAALDAFSLAAVRSAMDTNQYDLHFLVATLADACDSYTGALFDPMLDSIRLAVENAGYVVDRFFLPDWNPVRADGSTGDRCSGRTHERHPGVVLFRHDSSRSLIVLFLVPETPTAGILPAAFVRSVAFITRWEGAAPGDADTASGSHQIRIIGPTFSGSSASIARAIAGLPPGLAEDFDFEIISGSATSARNLTEFDALPAGPGHGVVRFSAATLPDPLLRCSMLSFLQTTLQVPAGDRALLRESNTGYGSDLGSRVLNNPEGARPDTQRAMERMFAEADRLHRALDGLAAGPATAAARAQLELQLADVSARLERTTRLLQESACISRDEAGAGWNERDYSVEVSFPLHVSRIRTSEPSALASGTLRVEVAEAAREVKLDEAQPPADLLPPLWPEITAPTVELALRALLQSVGQEGRRAVGIHATDLRDKIFLARELRRRTPDAVLFTSEADLLLAHPSFNAYTRGLLVASSYPVAVRTQGMADPEDAGQGRVQFASMAAEGTFNATTFHLRALANAGGVPAADVLAQLPLADYGPPFAAGPSLRPVVWINVVGRRRLWPVWVDAGASGSALAEAYTLADGAGSRSSPRAVAFAPSPVSVAAFVLFSGFAIAHVVAYSRRGGDRLTYLRRFRAHSVSFPGLAADAYQREQDTDRARSLLACFVSLTLVYGFVAGLCWTWFVFGAGGGIRVVPAVGAAAVLLALVGVTAHLAWRVALRLPNVGATRERTAAVRIARIVHRVGVGLVASLAVGYAAAYVMQSWPHRLVPGAPGVADLWSVFLFERASALTSGVSPLTTLGAFALVGYGWGASRLRGPGPQHDLRMSDRLTVLHRLSLLRAPWPTRDAPGTRGLPFPVVLAGVTVAIVGACWLFLGRMWPATIEGPRFNAMVFWAAVLLQVIVGTAVARLIHYRGVVQAHLERLAGDPIIDAFTRIPKALTGPTSFIIPPRLVEAEPLVRAWATLDADADLLIAELPPAAVPVRAAAATVSGDSAGPPPSSDPVAPRLPVSAGPAALGRSNLQAIFDDERNDSPGARWSDSHTRLASGVAALQLVDRLEEIRRLRDGLEHAGHSGGAARSWLFRARAWTEKTEEAIAIHLALSLREACSRLAGIAVFIMATSFLLLAGHTLFPIQPRQTLLGLTWANVGVAIVVGISGLVAIDRNGVLSDITQTPRGAINWNWALLRRVLVYAVLPLLSVLTVQFPEIGASIVQWIEPMQKALL